MLINCSYPPSLYLTGAQVTVNPHIVAAVQQCIGGSGGRQRRRKDKDKQEKQEDPSADLSGPKAPLNPEAHLSLTA